MSETEAVWRWYRNATLSRVGKSTVEIELEDATDGPQKYSVTIESILDDGLSMSPRLLTADSTPNSTGSLAVRSTEAARLGMPVGDDELRSGRNYSIVRGLLVQKKGDWQWKALIGAELLEIEIGDRTQFWPHHVTPDSPSAGEDGSVLDFAIGPAFKGTAAYANGVPWPEAEHPADVTTTWSPAAFPPRKLATTEKLSRDSELELRSDEVECEVEVWGLVPLVTARVRRTDGSVGPWLNRQGQPSNTAAVFPLRIHDPSWVSVRPQASGGKYEVGKVYRARLNVRHLDREFIELGMAADQDQAER